ncbi:MAG: twin-arginine translocation signal domain-containing protein, partial [Acidimicrobiaceae bacterium]|nr:twin-arginine translocation signal domain-containing protein [Acidimicrobiaceae bacterium]
MSSKDKDSEQQDETTGRGTTRRQFLTRAGAAGAAAAVTGTLGGTELLGGSATPAEAARFLPPGVPSSSHFFGRIFPNLRPFAPATDRVKAALLEVGMEGGIMDANDDLAAGPVALITDPTVNGNPTATNAYGTNPDNPTMTAGSTFVGQFIDHDISLDQTSQFGVPQNPLTSPDTRTPALDLDSVFGGGPTQRPDLYVSNSDGSVGPKLKIGSGGVHETIPFIQNPDGSITQLLGDPRNDEQLMTGGLHAAHILFYNQVIDDLPNINPSLMGKRSFDTSTNFEIFLTARQITQWHYQWLLVNEHLVQICGQSVVSDVIANGNRFYRPPRGDGFMPIEFAGALYRFGHSQVRPSYRANFSSGTGDSSSPTKDPFFGLVFDPTITPFDTPADRDDLLGGFPAPRRYIGWQTFFDAGDGQVKTNKKIDPTISTVLFKLPVPTIAPHTQTAPVVLPQRNLLRQLTWSLPSGQDMAKAM